MGSKANAINVKGYGLFDVLLDFIDTIPIFQMAVVIGLGYKE
ncbi:hypothetical protein [Cecembia rubra]|nr:hypothetical protein [Cecembia rubra]